MKKRKDAPGIIPSNLKWFFSYRHRARRRGQRWGLSIREFYRLVTRACYYCDYFPQKKPTPGVEFRGSYNGLDRLNNPKGYVISNVKPACGECNSLKSNLLTPKEMRVVAQALNKFRRSLGKGVVEKRKKAFEKRAQERPKGNRGNRKRKAGTQ